MLNNKIRRFKINGFSKDKEFNSLPFGRQIEGWKEIEKFKAGARVGYLSIKRRAFAPSFKEFRELNNVAQYFLEYYDDANYKDDTVKIYFKD